jgi:hypothetical protein
MIDVLLNQQFKMLELRPSVGMKPRRVRTHTHHPNWETGNWEPRTENWELGT